MGAKCKVIKVKLCDKTALLWSTVVLWRCPDLQILFSRFQKTCFLSSWFLYFFLRKWKQTLPQIINQLRIIISVKIMFFYHIAQPHCYKTSKVTTGMLHCICVFGTEPHTRTHWPTSQRIPNNMFANLCPASSLPLHPLSVYSILCKGAQSSSPLILQVLYNQP